MTSPVPPGKPRNPMHAAIRSGTMRVIMGSCHRVIFALLTVGLCFGGCATSGDSNTTPPAATGGSAGSAGAAGQAGKDAGPAGAAGTTSDAQPESSPDGAPEDVSQDPTSDTAPPDDAKAEQLADQIGPDITVLDVSTEGILCGQSVCSGSDQCCAEVDGGTTYTQCMPSCPDGGVSLSCDGPEDCVGKGLFCCAKLHVGYGSAPNCPIESAVASCTAACDTDVPMNCPDDGQVRLCHLSADCDNDMPYCCVFQQGGAGVTFCVNQLMSSLASACY
jgi:hypothetical protein